MLALYPAPIISQSTLGKRGWVFLDVIRLQTDHWRGVGWWSVLSLVAAHLFVHKIWKCRGQRSTAGQSCSLFLTQCQECLGWGGQWKASNSRNDVAGKPEGPCPSCTGISQLSTAAGEKVMVLLKFCGEKGQGNQNPLISQEAAWPEAEILQEVRGRVNPASGMPRINAMDRAKQEFILHSNHAQTTKRMCTGKQEKHKPWLPSCCHWNLKSCGFQGVVSHYFQFHSLGIYGSALLQAT